MNSDPSITCGVCSTTSPLLDWKGAEGAELRSNRYQCPRCSYAFERRLLSDRYGIPRIHLKRVDAELALAPSLPRT